MATPVLTRAKTPDECVENPDADTAGASEELMGLAAERLGYRRGSQALRLAGLRLADARKVVEACDVTCSPRPFTHDSVEAYMRYMAPESARLRAVAYFLVSLFLVCGFTGLSATIAVVLHLVQSKPVDGPMTLLGASVAIAAASWAIIAKTRLANVDNQWHLMSLDIYHDRVPEFALQTACDLSEKLPDAKFFVAHLSRSEDPFLGVELHGTTMYLEVWNEPRYRQSRVR